MTYGPAKPRKPPTGSGIIGQTGNKPGGSLKGYADPPREGLYGSRPISDHEIKQISANVACAVRCVIVIWLVTAAIGFILSRIL